MRATSEYNDHRYYLHSGWVDLLIQAGRNYQVELESLNSYQELLESSLKHPDIRVVQKFHQELIENSQFDLSIEAAKCATPLTFDSFSVALWSSQTLHQCLQNLCDYFIVLAPQAHLSLVEDGDNTELWIINNRTPDSYTVTQTGISLVVCLILEMLRTLNQGQSVPCRLYAPFHHYPQALVDKFCQRYRVPDIEKGPIRKIVFHREALKAVSPFAHEQLMEHNLLRVKEQAAKLSKNDIRLQVCRVLDELETLRGINVDLVAKRLLTSSRTLNRRLADAQTTFKTLLNNYRLEKALTLLKNPNNNMTEIAFQLGFSELSSFTRAFKRWTGESPSEVSP
ncbi:helix-turn-helix transcriptional regulator [Vibrio paucivorans]